MSQTAIDINEEALLADGWVKQEAGTPFLYEKDIENRNPLNADPEDTGLKLCVHNLFNVAKFAVVFPDGGLLNFVANSMAELKDFESRLDFYDCPY